MYLFSELKLESLKEYLGTALQNLAYSVTLATQKASQGGHSRDLLVAKATLEISNHCNVKQKAILKHSNREKTNISQIQNILALLLYFADRRRVKTSK